MLLRVVGLRLGEIFLRVLDELSHRLFAAEAIGLPWSWAWMEQSVCMSLPRARPIVHMLPYSPVSAIAAVAIPSKKAPATAGVMYALTIVVPPRGLRAFDLYTLGAGLT
jgi:hypothetical protein